LDKRSVVRFVAVPAKLTSRLAHRFFIAARDSDHLGCRCVWKEAANLAIGVGMRSPHELVSNQSDANGLFLHANISSHKRIVVAASVASTLSVPTPTLLRPVARE